MYNIHNLVITKNNLVYNLQLSLYTECFYTHSQEYSPSVDGQNLSRNR